MQYFVSRKQTRARYEKRLPALVFEVAVFLKMFLITSQTLHCNCGLALKFGYLVIFSLVRRTEEN